MNLYINGDEIQAVGEMPVEIKSIGTSRQTRMSNVLPVNRIKRAAFLLLRACFGERGRIAEWTRQWQGPWCSKIFTTGECFTHQSRRVVLAWEHQRLEQLIESGKIKL